MRNVNDYLKMATNPAASAAATSLINSDLKEIGDATVKLANHVIQLGVDGGGFVTSLLQWFAFVSAFNLLILDKTSWRTKMLMSLLVPYVLLTCPNWLFESLRGDIGKWIALIGVVFRLFFPNHFKEDLLLPGSLLILIVVSPSFVAGYVRAGWIGVIICLGIGCYLFQEHVRACGGFKEAFKKANGISNSIGIAFLFIFPVWAFIGLAF